MHNIGFWLILNIFNAEIFLSASADNNLFKLYPQKKYHIIIFLCISIYN